MQAANLNFDKSSLLLKRDPKLVSHILSSLHWLLELPGMILPILLHLLGIAYRMFDVDELDILTSERLFSEAIETIDKARTLIVNNPQLGAVEDVIKDDLNLRIKHLSEVDCLHVFSEYML